MLKKNQNFIFNMPGKNMRFDIPLHARVGTEFLALLMALMTFLCLLAGLISISLNNMADAWTTGLADTITIEIPSEHKDDDKIEDLVKKLNGIANVKQARLVDRKELEKLVEPWLGDSSAALGDLPVPALINIEMNERSPELIENINKAVESEIPQARVDAHDNWLNDLLKLTKGLQIAGAALIAIISIVTALTVSGAVRSRMAIHHSELELLHIMGASDKYITRQFQKYILVLSGKGIALGFVFALLSLAIVHFLSLKLPETLPHFDFSLEHSYAMPVIALALLCISTFAAKRTVMNVLKEMP